MANAKDKVLKKKVSGAKLHKTHHSDEYCRHCGEKTRSTTTHESGHREYDHEMAKVDAPRSLGMKR